MEFEEFALIVGCAVLGSALAMSVIYFLGC